MLLKFSRSKEKYQWRSMFLSYWKYNERKRLLKPSIQSRKPGIAWEDICKYYILLGNVAIFQEAVAQRCSVKKVFLEILQNSQENTFARVSLLKKSL